MKNSYRILLLFAVCRTCEAQNLVPNPGFEDTGSVYCGIYLPANFNSSVHYWYTPSQGTPDLFSTQIDPSCWNYQPNSTYGGPICILGSQLPRSGSVFAGLGCYTIPGLNQREYIQSPLASPLITGHTYYVEFYATLADHKEKYTDKLGAYFSESAVTLNTDDPLPYIPQVSATSFISDTASWVKISGTFLATSAFNYITIGNFYDDAGTPTLLNPGGSGGPGCYGAYYYIDDVRVIDSTVIDTTVIDPPVIDTTVFYFRVFPNPFTDKLLFTTETNEITELTFFDIAGRIVFKRSFTQSISINTEHFARSTYMFEVRYKNGDVKKGMVVKM